jgi:hypothetical protein
MSGSCLATAVAADYMRWVMGAYSNCCDKKKINHAPDNTKSLASISLSISTVYLEKKPKYFFRASAEVRLHLYIM